MPSLGRVCVSEKRLITAAKAKRIAIVEMREAVQHYCDLIENATPGRGGEFIDEVKVALAELLAAAPRTEPSGDPDPGFEHELAPQAESEMMRRLAAVIGERDFYRMVYEPFEDSGEPVGGMLSEDLASVWRDLRPGLDLLGGPHEADALFDWWFGYRAHWGRHAVAALFALVHSSYF